MTLLLDAGALIALDRNDRETWRRLESARRQGEDVCSHGGVVGQAWRTGAPRQARLARALAGVDVRPLDHALGRAAGKLLGRARMGDVIDAALVLLARDGDMILTSDTADIERLAEAADCDVEIVRV